MLKPHFWSFDLYSRRLRTEGESQGFWQELQKFNCYLKWSIKIKQFPKAFFPPIQTKLELILSCFLHFQPGDHNPGPNPFSSEISSNTEVALKWSSVLSSLHICQEIMIWNAQPHFTERHLMSTLHFTEKHQNKPQEPYATLVAYSLLNFQEQLAGYPLFWFLSWNLIIPYVLSHFVWFAIVFLIIILWGYAAISSSFILSFMFHLYKINYIVPSSTILTVSPLHCVCL